MSTEQVNLEALVAVCVADALARGFHSATVAAALVRGAARMARVKSATREQFVEAAGKAFDAVGGDS